MCDKAETEHTPGLLRLGAARTLSSIRKGDYHGEGLFPAITHARAHHAVALLPYRGGWRGMTSRELANAKRFVACWNACLDIPTKALEAGVVKDLLEACEKLVELSDSGECPPNRLGLIDALIPIAERARAAIAEAKPAMPNREGA